MQSLLGVTNGTQTSRQLISIPHTCCDTVLSTLRCINCQQLSCINPVRVETGIGKPVKILVQNVNSALLNSCQKQFNYVIINDVTISIAHILIVFD